MVLLILFNLNMELTYSTISRLSREVYGISDIICEEIYPRSNAASVANHTMPSMDILPQSSSRFSHVVCLLVKMDVFVVVDVWIKMLSRFTLVVFPTIWDSPECSCIIISLFSHLPFLHITDIILQLDQKLSYSYKPQWHSFILSIDSCACLQGVEVGGYAHQRRHNAAPAILQRPLNLNR